MDLSVNIVTKTFCPNFLKITYPFISNMEDFKLQERLNKILDKFLCDFLIDQIPFSKENINPTALMGSYECFLNRNNLISLLYTIDSHTENSPNGIKILKSITLNTASTRVYTFRDLFRSNIKYKHIISEWVKNYIRINDIPLINDYESISSDQKFYITPSSLVLYYEIYEYTYHTFGPLIIEIPFKEIKYILNPSILMKIISTYKENEKIEDPLLHSAFYLFKEAINEFGAISPEDAALLWAKGVKLRNGALQYALLSKELKRKMDRSLQNTSWITGASSPHVEDFKIFKNRKLSKDTFEIMIKFHIVSNKTDAGYVDSILTIKKIGRYWTIIKIK